MTGGAAKAICGEPFVHRCWIEIYAVRERIAAIGAALVAAFGYGEFEDLTKSVKRIKIERIHVSRIELCKRYREKYGKYLNFEGFVWSRNILSG